MLISSTSFACWASLPDSFPPSLPLSSLPFSNDEAEKEVEDQADEEVEDEDGKEGEVAPWWVQVSGNLSVAGVRRQ